MFFLNPVFSIGDDNHSVYIESEAANLTMDECSKESFDRLLRTWIDVL